MDVRTQAYVRALLGNQEGQNHPMNWGLKDILTLRNRAMDPNQGFRQPDINAMKENNFFQLYGRPPNQELDI